MAPRLIFPVGVAVLLLALPGCASVPAAEGAARSPALANVEASDSARFMVPPGYGTLHQEDIALRMQVLGLQVRAIPLDETIIRLLSPDSYRTLRGLATSQEDALAAISERTSLHQLSLWYVSFTGLEQGETPFSPQELRITSVGRDFHPLDVLPITTGFGQHRLRQRETQSALYVFDPQVDVNQPLTMQFQTSLSTDWGVILSRVERERALVRSRAGIRNPRPGVPRPSPSRRFRTAAEPASTPVPPDRP